MLELKNSKLLITFMWLEFVQMYVKVLFSQTNKISLIKYVGI